MCRLKSVLCRKYGLGSQPKLVDIIAAVPSSHKKAGLLVHMLTQQALLPKLKAKPVRTASGVYLQVENRDEIRSRWWR